MLGQDFLEVTLPQHSIQRGYKSVPSGHADSRVTGGGKRGTGMKTANKRMSAPGLPKPAKKVGLHNRVLNAIVDHPVDTQLLMALDELQDSAQALGHVETVLPATLLPRKDGQELQGIGWGQSGVVLGGNLHPPKPKFSGGGGDSS